MTPTAPILCPFCGSANQAASECQACGGPLEGVAFETNSIPEMPLAQYDEIGVPVSLPPVPKSGSDDVQELARTASLVGRSALMAYSLVWRTLAEAIAIGLTGFVLGTLGGLTGLGPWGVLAAALVGMLIGRAHKRTIGILTGAPGGALIGLLLGVILTQINLPPQILLLSTTVGALIGAPIGSRPVGMFRWWQKLRPWLGLFGGLGFGILGLFVGWSIAAALAITL